MTMKIIWVVTFVAIALVVGLLIGSKGKVLSAAYWAQAGE